MESTILDAFLEYGSMGLFAGFLVWQHLSMQKRFDALVEKFQGQLEGIQSKAESNEDKLRDRYDTVIKQYQEDKTTFRLNVAEQISEAMRSIDSLKSHMDGLPFDSLQIQIEAIALNQRNSHLILEKGMDQLRKMEEDQRLKEMAKRMSDGKDT